MAPLLTSAKSSHNNSSKKPKKMTLKITGKRADLQVGANRDDNNILMLVC
jgi:hypothetical protein